MPWDLRDLPGKEKRRAKQRPARVTPTFTGELKEDKETEME